MHVRCTTVRSLWRRCVLSFLLLLCLLKNCNVLFYWDFSIMLSQNQMCLMTAGCTMRHIVSFTSIISWGVYETEIIFLVNLMVVVQLHCLARRIPQFHFLWKFTFLVTDKSTVDTYFFLLMNEECPHPLGKNAMLCHTWNKVHASYQLCVSSRSQDWWRICVLRSCYFTCVRLPVVNFVYIIHSLVTTVFEIRIFITFFIHMILWYHVSFWRL